MQICNNINVQQHSNYVRKYAINNSSNYGNSFICKETSHTNPMIYSQLACSINNINFTSNVSNGSFLRNLTGVHDPYSGVVILNNKEINQIYQDLAKKETSYDKIRYLKNYTESMLPVEHKVFDIIKDELKINNQLSMQEILKKRQPKALENLIQEQENIFDKIDRITYNLSDENKFKVAKSLDKAKHQIKLPHEDKHHFKNSKFECEIMRIAQNKTLKKIEERMNKLPQNEKDAAFERLNNVKQIFENTPYYTNIKGKTPLKMLHELQKDYIPNTLNEENEMQKILELSQTLPTTKNSVNAFIVEMADKDDKTISKRLVSEALGTIEHVIPDSKGGANEAYNFLFVTKSRNEERGNRSINKFKHKYPDIPSHCQQYLDDVIRNCENGKLRGFEWYPYLIKDTLKNEIGANVAIKSYRMSPYKAFKAFPERLKDKYPQFNQYYTNKK